MLNVKVRNIGVAAAAACLLAATSFADDVGVIRLTGSVSPQTDTRVTIEALEELGVVAFDQAYVPLTEALLIRLPRAPARFSKRWLPHDWCHR